MELQPLLISLKFRHKVKENKNKLNQSRYTVSCLEPIYYIYMQYTQLCIILYKRESPCHPLQPLPRDIGND